MQFVCTGSEGVWQALSGSVYAFCVGIVGVFSVSERMWQILLDALRTVMIIGAFRACPMEDNTASTESCANP